MNHYLIVTPGAAPMATRRVLQMTYGGSPATPVAGHSPHIERIDSMEDVRHHYLAWLRNTHAMEEQAQTMLNGQLQRLENYPELSARIREHLVETEHQAAALHELLESRAASTSMVKDAVAKVMAMGQAVSGMFTDDEVVKGSMASYAFEHVEIAAYKTLIAAAEYLGDTEAVPVFQRILREEIAMADWLSDHLARTVQTFLQRDAANVQAKR